MMNTRITTLLLCLGLLLAFPRLSLAWHDYGGAYGYWDYYGSGRDHPYSYYIDKRYSGGYTDDLGPDYDDGVLLVTPSVQSPPPQPLEVQELPPDQLQEFTVNVPNNNGGYTAVTLKRSGQGFTGPQGEYYPQFPAIAQLKVIYGSTPAASSAR